MKKQLIATAAMMGLIGAATISVVAQAADSVHCAGANSCKGKSACKSDKNTCKGTNGCKGQGWVAMSKTKCDAWTKKHAPKDAAPAKADDSKG